MTLTAGPTGLLFLAVVLLWAGYLVPYHARERARAAEDRRAQREAELLHRGDTSRPRVLLTTGEPELTSTARLNAGMVAAAELRTARRLLRRGRAARVLALASGVVLVVASLVGAAVITLPWWTATAALGWLGTAALTGAAAARRDRRRVATAIRRRRAARDFVPAAPARTRSVPLFDRGGPGSPDSQLLPPAPVDDGPAEDEGWLPVSVPRPTYVLAPRVAQAPPLPWVDPAPRPDVAAPTERPTPRPAARRVAERRAEELSEPFAVGAGRGRESQPSGRAAG